jgi:hypothetical protein
MRGLFVGAAITIAIVSGFVVGKPALADGPGTDERDALSQLSLAGAPLIEETARGAPSGVAGRYSATPSLPSSIAPSPPSGPAAAPSSAVSPPEPGPEVQPQLPDIPAPNPLDWLNNLDPTKWAGDILNAVLTTIGKALLEAIREFVDWATGFGDSSLNFVTRTPAEGTYESPTVRSLWDFSRALVNLALAAIVMWGGFNVIQRAHTKPLPRGDGAPAAAHPRGPCRQPDVGPRAA